MINKNDRAGKMVRMDKEPRVRLVENGPYLGTLRELILEGHEVSLLVAGSSMAPLLIHQRDTVILGPVKDPLKKGTIVFYQRQNEQYVLHRIQKVCGDGVYDIVGDNQTDIERGIRREQIFAQVNKLSRKGRWIGPGDFWWEFFEKVWINAIPLRRPMQKLYGCFFGRKDRSNL